uniref:ATP synthase F0 subunit 8 n=1 Tax=Andrena labiata TaxID=1431441 RepID=A0A0S2LT69_9HYME|nr:ATP synthase F0 subunit 8 [Andrena labiata]
MPQMKPMLWTIMMMMTLTMIMMTIITNFFTTLQMTNKHKVKKIKTMKWKW